MRSGVGCGSRLGWRSCILGLVLSLTSGGVWATEVASSSTPMACVAQAPVVPSGLSFSAQLRQTADLLRHRNLTLTELLPTDVVIKGKHASADLVEKLDAALIARKLILPDPKGPRQVYDAALKSGVKAAERTFGLVPDGMAGPLLFQNLNTSDAALAQNLDAWADDVDQQVATARSEGARFMALVNVPSFTLHLIDVATGVQVLESRVIVGKVNHQTPLFQTHIINLKFNPDWTPPPSLVKTGHVYVPPGPHNPLGLLRFSTDNHLNIYLHDTNEHQLFARNSRAYSSGCIRVQQWKAMAGWLAQESECRIDKTLATGKTLYQKIEKTPVVLTYSLVDQVENGAGVRPDVYHVGQLAVGAPKSSSTPVSP